MTAPFSSFAAFFRAACLALALTAPISSAQTTQPSRPTLLAYGSSNHYWIASVESYREGSKTLYKTVVRTQSLPAGDWKDLGVVFGYAIGLAETQGEAAVLLDDGNWKRLGVSGLSTGAAVPGTGSVLAWGSAGPTLYAIRAVEGGRDAVKTADTRPTTASTTAATATTTSVKSVTPVLLRFDKGEWRPIADLPAGIGWTPTSLSGAGNKVLLASAAETGQVRAWTLAESKWEDWGEFNTAQRPTILGGMAIGHVPALWSMDQEGAVKLFVKRENEDWTLLKGFELPKGISEGARRTLTAAGEEIRLIVQSPNDGKIWEQRYDASGALRGGLTALPAPQTNTDVSLMRMVELAVLVAMVIVMLVTFYKRRSTPPGKEDEA